MRSDATFEQDSATLFFRYIRASFSGISIRFSSKDDSEHIFLEVGPKRIVQRGEIWRASCEFKMGPQARYVWTKKLVEGLDWLIRQMYRGSVLLKDNMFAIITESFLHGRHHLISYEFRVWYFVNRTIQEIWTRHAYLNAKSTPGVQSGWMFWRLHT